MKKVLTFCWVGMAFWFRLVIAWNDIPTAHVSIRKMVIGPSAVSSEDEYLGFVVVTVCLAEFYPVIVCTTSHDV